MKGKGRFIRNMERDWKMKNEAKKYRGKYDQSILYTYVKFSKKITGNSKKYFNEDISQNVWGITLRGRKKYENETAITVLSQRNIKESRYRRLIEP